MSTADSPFDPLDQAIIRQLRTIPGVWTDVDLDAIAHIDGEAITLLNRSGMIEGRCRITFERDDPRELLSLVAVISGEFRDQPHFLSSFGPGIPQHWIGADGKVNVHLRLASDGFHQIRRTHQGELVVQDLYENAYLPLHYVRRQGFHRYRPVTEEKVRIESREFKQQQSAPSPSATANASAQASVGDVNVNVSNNIDLSGVAQMLADLMKRSPEHEESRGKKQTGRPPKDEKDSTTKVLAGLAKLHRYENGSVGDLDLRSVAEIAEASSTSDASVSRALCDIFGVPKDGHKAYGIACRQERLAAILAAKMCDKASYRRFCEEESDEDE